MAKKIDSLIRQNARLRTAARDMLTAWDALPPGRYSPEDIERWIVSDRMREAVSNLRNEVG